MVAVCMSFQNVWSLEDCGTKESESFKTQLIGHLDPSKKLDLWTKKEAQNLSFCVSDKFGANFERIKSVTKAAAEEWMTYAHVDFKTNQIAACETSQSSFLFKVVPVTRRSKYRARAFFPSSQRRKVEINRRFDRLGDLELKQLILHEFGHVLGFRHEHIHVDNQDDCREAEEFAPITDYDPLSIMHYKNCTLGGLRNYVLSELDKAGAVVAYPFDI